MLDPLFAIWPPGLMETWIIGGLVVLGAVGLFVRATRVSGRERERRAGLGCLALVSGPLLGAALAWLTCTFGDVSPLDVGYTYGVFTIIGGIAGFLGGVAFLLTAMFGPVGAGARRDGAASSGRVG